MMTGRSPYGGRDLLGAIFYRAGTKWCVLGECAPGFVCAVRVKDREPAPISMLAKPKKEEIDPSTPVDPAYFEERQT